MYKLILNVNSLPGRKVSRAASNGTVHETAVLWGKKCRFIAWFSGL